ncbi:hypothetical protein LDENG_00021600 [Lucifuga dentata]|nr:hypothetical protein LDENG_00021600 [Lucifuga dentata]
MLFIDLSSAFNTIVPQQLTGKLNTLAFNILLCNWILDFLTRRPQSVRIGSSSNHIINYAADMTVVGLITNNDESHYREEVEQLVTWCSDNNLSLSVGKTTEMVTDFRRGHSESLPPSINHQQYTAIKRVSSIKFLGVHIADDLTKSTRPSSAYTSCRD